MPNTKKESTHARQSSLKNAIPKVLRRRRHSSLISRTAAFSDIPDRFEKERRVSRLILALTAAVVMCIVAIVSVGFYLTNVAPPKEVVAEFSESQITANDVKKQMKIQSAQAVLNNNLEGLNFNPGDILTAMVQTAITQFYSFELGLKDDYNQVEQQILIRLIPQFEERKQEEEFTKLQEEFEKTLIDFVELLGIDEEYYRNVLAGQILLGDAFEYFRKQVPQENEEVFVSWIKTSTKNNVEDVRQRLLAGDDFHDIAKTYNEDIKYAAENGEVGWIPRGAFPELEGALFQQELNNVEEITVKDVYTGRDVTYFTLITYGPSVRPISTEMEVLVSKNLYFDWFSSKQLESGLNIVLTEESTNWINSEVSKFLIDIMPQLEAPTDESNGDDG